MLELLTTNKIEKSYKNKKAVCGISFKVIKGEVLCLLGPNGAGKSTTINILTTAMKQDAGEIYYKSALVKANNNDYKNKLGVVPQDIALYEDITAQQNVSFFAALYGLKGKELAQNVHYALNFVGLSDKSKDKVSTFSGGMKRRLNIACAIAHKPEIIIMDEPTVGIDPQSRNHILEAIKRMKDEGSTIIYTTHYMEEVEQISDRIIIMDYGRIIAEGTKETLKDKYAAEKQIEVEVDKFDFDLNKFYSLDGVIKASQSDNTISLDVLKGIENIDKIITLVMGMGCFVRNITVKAPSLERVFLKLTGRELRD